MYKFEHVAIIKATIMISEDSSDEFDSKKRITQSSSSSSGMHYGYTWYLSQTHACMHACFIHNSYIIDEHEILIPLEDITIPPEYLLPEFQEEENLLKQEEEHDIFSFGSRSMEKRVRDCVKAHIRDCPESILPLESERL